MRSGRTNPQGSVFSSPQWHSLPEWPSQEEPVSGWTVSAPVSGVSAPSCSNGVWPPLRPVNVAQKSKPSTMLSSNVQSIDLSMDCIAWRFWMMRQANGCSAPAPRSSAAKQWFEQLAQKKKHAVDRFSSVWDQVGMKISPKRIDVLWPYRHSGQCLLNVSSNTRKQVAKFKYVGVVFTSGGRRSEETDTRIVKANTVLFELYRSVDTTRELSTITRLSVFKSVFVRILTYGHESWVMNDRKSATSKCKRQR